MKKKKLKSNGTSHIKKFKQDDEKVMEIIYR